MCKQIDTFNHGFFKKGYKVAKDREQLIMIKYSDHLPKIQVLKTRLECPLNDRWMS